jgi:hypothetical protein
MQGSCCHFYLQAASSGLRLAFAELENKPTMTCRIERVVIGEVILRISGQVTRQEVDLLQALLERETKAPILDLKDVLLVDREAIKLLAARELNGVELRNCSAYIREWITKERSDGSALGQMTEDSKPTGDF